MTSAGRITLIFLLVIGCTTPSLAQSDPSTLTCGQFKALGGADKDQAARSLMLWARSSSNSAGAGILPSMFSNMTKQGVHQLIDRRCMTQPDGAKVVAVLQEGA